MFSPKKGLIAIAAGAIMWLLLAATVPLVQAGNDTSEIPDLQGAMFSAFAPACYYTVEPGDTLGRIAGLSHKSVAFLAAINGIRNVNVIRVGQVLNICGASAPSGGGVTPNALAMKLANWTNTYPWGQCTWYGAQASVRNLDGLGNARDWPTHARARGLPMGTTPQVGAIVVYAPGVDGAGALGHVAVVHSVLADGQFVIYEMNRAGWHALDGSPSGFGKVDAWLSHTGGGETFLY